MTITWATDIHSEFCDDSTRSNYYASLANSSGEVILLTEDIASHNRTGKYLQEMQEATGKRIFFVLGNHDFYGTHFRDVTSTVDSFCMRNPKLVRLDTQNAILLNDHTSLIGHGGWSCGTAGLGILSPVRINDEVYIRDLGRLSREALFATMRRRAEESAIHVQMVASRTTASSSTVLVATHVPPFPAACLFEGKPTEPCYLPYFCNAILGAALMEAAAAHPETRFIVLCGHTHAAARYSPLENLTVITAAAEYRQPTIAAVIDPETPHFPI